MMMYLDGEASEEPYNEFALRMTEFMGAIQNRRCLPPASRSAAMSCRAPITRR